MDHHAHHHTLPVWLKIAAHSAYKSLFVLLFMAQLLSPFTPVRAAPLLAATFSVNSTADSVDANPGNGLCADASGYCTLRAAIMEANALSGTDLIQLPAGTYTLTQGNAGGVNEDNSRQGDLDILTSMTIQGAGAASTIIQAGTDATNGIDKVFGVNPLCTGPVNVTIDGVTIQYGRNTQAYDGTYFSHTGGGLDYCSNGVGGTFNLSNAVISENTNVNYYGGGLNVDVLSPSTITITNVLFEDNRTLHTSNTANGGAINVNGIQTSLIIQNSAFRGNSVAGNNTAGGAIYFATANSGGSLQIHHSVFDNNTAGGYGGALYIGINNTSTTITIDQGTQVTNNTARTAGGGGITLSGSTTTPVTISEVNIAGNHALGTDTGYGGGGLWIGQANAMIQYSRIVDNTTASANATTGLRKNADTGTVTATNNWWGCSGGPGAVGCDSVSIGAGTVTTDPHLLLQAGANPNTLSVGQSSEVMAGFGLAPEIGDGVAGTAVSWGASGGTLSGQQATIQSNGWATTSYQATSSGPSNQVTVTVDHTTTTVNLTVNKANSSTTLTASPNPGVFGESLTFTAAVTSASGTPLNGNVTFSADGSPVCSNVALNSGIAQCTTSSLSQGNHTATAVYQNDPGHNNSTDALANLAVLARPSITDMVDTSTEEDTATQVDFTIADADTPVDNLSIQVTSSNETLVPAGNITVNRSGANCSLTITPVINLSGETNLNVTVTDPNGLAASDKLKLTVTAVNDPPVITEGDGSIQITLDENGSPTAFPPTTLHATDVDSATLTWSIMTIPLMGTAEVNESGVVTYTPFVNVSGSDGFIVMVSDGVLFDTVQFKLTITPGDHSYYLFLPFAFGN